MSMLTWTTPLPELGSWTGCCKGKPTQHGWPFITLWFATVDSVSSCPKLMSPWHPPSDGRCLGLEPEENLFFLALDRVIYHSNRKKSPLTKPGTPNRQAPDPQFSACLVLALQTGHTFLMFYVESLHSASPTCVAGPLPTEPAPQTKGTAVLYK